MKDTLQDIVKNYASQGLRRLASDYQAEALTGSCAMTHIECDLTHYLQLVPDAEERNVIEALLESLQTQHKSLH